MPNNEVERITRADVGSTITVRIEKTSDDDNDFGLTFGERKARNSDQTKINGGDGDGDNNKAVIIISDLDKDGLANQTALHKGMELLSLNGIDVADIQSSEAANQIITSPQEDVQEITIVAKHPLGFIPICIHRPTEEPLGISLGNAKERRKKPIIVLTKIEEGSLAAQHHLRDGMIVRAVHHKKCCAGDKNRMTVEDVFHAIYHHPQGQVKLLVEESNPFSRRAETLVYDTYAKAPPPSNNDDDDDNHGVMLLPPSGYWLVQYYCGCKDIIILPCLLVLATFGLIFTDRNKMSQRSVYVVNGLVYDEHGKLLGRRHES